MSIQPVRLYGDPVLRTRAAEVIEFDDALRRLIDDLHDTLDDQRGAGLAAPQIGVGLRVFVYDVEGRRGHMVNPVLELPDSETQDEDLEGCLSLPGGLLYPRKRRMRAVCRGFDMRGEPVEIRGEGFMARALQHEADHLRGRLFVDGLDADRRAELEADLERQDWYTAGRTAVHTDRDDSKGVFFKR
ncbi:peptide deformylase [Glycomyces sp. L485]|uniref:peptide deformylase n=1 Tax=Glycomyces sp. L485 TaxID=2909235 RepID=UPI001F4B8CF4|nr:peptide deformylase [Glycomyces sp. L485]MCH7230044.1 peptide deformylase [Glycomyces sp. L485]